MTERDSTRGGRLKRADNLVQGDIGRKLIVTIGIDEYQHMDRLHNAVSDALGIHEFFTDEKIGFEAPLSPLLNGGATKDAINSLLEDGLPAEVGEDDAVVLFFAGHGRSRTLGTSELGYLVPVEGRPNQWGDYVRIKDFLDRLDGIPARHVVVILDACRSGFALGRSILRTRSETPRFARDLLGRKSRHVLTSALADQDAYDGGPIDKHSLFTGFLIHGLSTGAADRDGNGVVMTRELSDYVTSSVANYSEGKQTPDFGTFSIHNDERGQLFFPSLGPVTAPVAVPALAPLTPEVAERSPLLSRLPPLPNWARTRWALGAVGVVAILLLALLIYNASRSGGAELATLEARQTALAVQQTAAATPLVSSFTIVDVVPDESVTIETTNFPPDRNFVVTMGEFGTLGIDGTYVEMVNSGAGGTFQLSLPIPARLHGAYRLALRLQNNTDESDYAYNWFYNNRGAASTPAVTRTSANTKTSTPTPTRTPGTPTATYVSSVDDCEPNDSFDTACLILLELSYDADFVPLSRTEIDSDFYRFPVKRDRYYVCETFNLSSVNDTSMTLYSEADEEAEVDANDDKAMGDLGSQVDYLATYTGMLYVLVEPTPNREPEYRDSYFYTYTLGCRELTATPTPTTEPTAVSIQGETAAVPTQPAVTFINVKSVSVPSGQQITPDQTTIELEIEYGFNQTGKNAAIFIDVVDFESPDCTDRGPYGVDTLAAKGGGIKTGRSSGTLTQGIQINSAYLQSPDPQSVSILVRLYEEGAESYSAQDDTYATRCYSLP